MMPACGKFLTGGGYAPETACVSTQKGRRAGELPGERETEGRLPCPGDVAQWHCGESGSERSKGSSSLGSHSHRLYAINGQQMLGGRFTGNAKQEGSQCIKICLSGLCLKQTDV